MPATRWCCSPIRTARCGIARRSRWGASRCARARALRGAGPYALQAQIAALHAEQPSDWSAIAELYGRLAALTASPVVELNRAVALAEAGDVAVALELVDGLALDGYHYLHATRAELLRRLGRDEQACAAYESALELVHAEAERAFLRQRLAELRRSPGDDAGG